MSDERTKTSRVVEQKDNIEQAVGEFLKKAKATEADSKSGANTPTGLADLGWWDGSATTQADSM